MAAKKIAATLDAELLRELDRLVASRKYPNRSRALNQAARQLVEEWRKRRLAEECAKLDPAEETALAEEGMGADEWPAY